jgi:hypothetical protein
MTKSSHARFAGPAAELHRGQQNPCRAPAVQHISLSSLWASEATSAVPET